ncbi:hypothetical protein [Actinocorallia lasiicapitis]
MSGRYFVPLALWYTVGQSVRYGLQWLGFEVGLKASWLPLLLVSLMVVTHLAVTVAMLHSVREGLPAISERDESGALASWAVGNDEPLIDALSRAVLPFMIFYLAWGWFGRDAQDFQQAVTSRGIAEGEMGAAMNALLSIQKQLWVAVLLVVVFFAVRVAIDRWLTEPLPRVSALAGAFCECAFALYGVFTIDELRGKGVDWLTSRVFWDALPAEHLGTVWEHVKEPVLGSLLWLVIAGVVLGVDAADERAVFGTGRMGARLARGAGLGERPAEGEQERRTLREFLTRGLRDKWLPAWYGMRLIGRAGLLPFGMFALLYVGLDVVEDLTNRAIYVLVGPRDIAWWLPRLDLIGYGTGLLFQLLRIGLLAAAFDLVIQRVSERNAAPEPDPNPPGPAPAAPAQPYQPAPWAARP